MMTKIILLMFSLLIAGCAILYGNVPVEERDMIVSVPFPYPHGNFGCAQAYSHSPLLAIVTSRQDDRSANLSLYSPSTGLLLYVEDPYPTYVAVGQHDCRVELPDDLFHSSKDLRVMLFVIANDNLKTFLKLLESQTPSLPAEDRNRLATLIANPEGSPFYYEVGKDIQGWNRVDTLSVSEKTMMNKARKYLNLSQRSSARGEDFIYPGGYYQLWLDMEKLDQSTVRSPD